MSLIIWYYILYKHEHPWAPRHAQFAEEELGSQEVCQGRTQMVLRNIPRYEPVSRYSNTFLGGGPSHSAVLKKRSTPSGHYESLSKSLKCSSTGSFSAAVFIIRYVGASWAKITAQTLCSVSNKLVKNGERP